MRVIVTNPEVTVEPNRPAVIDLEVTNDLEVIDSISLAFPSDKGLTWTPSPDQLPLFPESAGRMSIRLEVTSTFPSGQYRLPIQVRSAVGEGHQTSTLTINIPPIPGAEVSVEPVVRTGRHKAEYQVRVDNTGNTTLEVALAATDPMRQVPARFVEPILEVGPGSSAFTEMQVHSKRHFLGSDFSHQLTVLGSADEVEVDTKAVFRQQPVIPRGVRTVMVLGTIIAVWAAIFVVGLNKAMSHDPLTKDVPASFYASISGKSPNTKASALGEGVVSLASSDGGAPAGAIPKSGLVVGVGGAVSGTVVAKSTGAGVGRINVEAVQILPNSQNTVASAATAATGKYTIQGLLPGSYKLLFEAQGYQSVWYPDATTSGAAKDVTVNAIQTTPNLNVMITGSPGSITGLVQTGETPAPTVTVTVQPEQGNATTPIATVKTNSDGSYTIPKLPTPGQYDLSFTAPGFQVASASDVLLGGEAMIANTVTMGAAAGSISGMVTAGGKPLGGVTISAQANGQTFTGATPTAGSVGEFSLANLPSPATYLLTFTLAGYGTRVIGENLGPGQSLTSLAVVMEGGAGSISGTVSSTSGTPLGGATVTVDGGASPLATQTLTAGTPGAYTLAGLSTPGTYTLTFILAGYQSQTISVPLTSSGSASNINVSLPLAIGSISGTLTNSSGGAAIAGATVTATNGTTVISTTTTSTPAGGYLLTGLPAGSYSITFSLTGYTNVTVLVILGSGQSATANSQMTAT